MFLTNGFEVYSVSFVRIGKGAMQISASMMCTDLVHLKETIEIFEEEKVDFLHIDVMDGVFVPNFGLGVDYIRSLRDLTGIPLDFHLMVMSPEYKFKWLGLRETDIVSVHYESTHQVQRALDWLGNFGCKKFLAINPATPVGALEEVLDYIDGVNLLTVNPGFAGQNIIGSVFKKAEKLKAFLSEKTDKKILIEVDGNISPENGARLANFGASIFVCGTSSIFRGNFKTYKDNIIEFRRAVSR